MAAMDHADQQHARQRELADLQDDFPGYRIWREAMGERVRLIAVRRAPGTSPHTVVAAEAGELRAALASPQAGPRVPVTGRHPDGTEEYPQAIADDYPGWQVRRHDGQWTAWCPAVTVSAATAAGLRAAIEQAITTNSPDP